MPSKGQIQIQLTKTEAITLVRALDYFSGSVTDPIIVGVVDETSGHIRAALDEPRG